MPGTHLLNGDNCEICGKRQQMKEHYPNFVPYPGGLREPNREWHEFMPHLKHKMKLEKTGYGYIKGRRLYFFECEICKYEHPCAIEDFHRINIDPKMSFEDIFERYGETFVKMGAAFEDVFGRIKKKEAPDKSWVTQDKVSDDPYRNKNTRG